MAGETATSEIASIVIINYLGMEIDIKNIFNTMTISQSLFNNTMFGEINVTDAEDLHTGFPFIGEEKIRIKYRTNDKFPWIEQEFSIYNVSDKIKSSQNSEMFTISFCSHEMMKNQFSVVSVSYKSKTVKQAVEGVFKYLDSKKPLNIDDTLGNVNFIVPSWTPFKTINNLAGKAQSQKYNGASFLFWETPAGFNFRSIEALHEQKAIDYTYATLSAVETDETPFYNVITLHQVKTQNILDAIPKGMFGGTAFTVDPLTKSIGVVDFDYNRDFEKIRHVEDSSSDQKFTSSKWPYKDVAKFGIYKAVLGRNRTGSWLQKSGNFDKEWFTKEKTLLARMSHLQQASNHIKMRARVPGNTALNAGDIVNLKIPSKDTFKSDDPVKRDNRLYAGRYLVTAIANVFTKTTFYSILELTKDCYKESPEDELREELFRS